MAEQRRGVQRNAAVAQVVKKIEKLGERHMRRPVEWHLLEDRRGLRRRHVLAHLEQHCMEITDLDRSGIVMVMLFEDAFELMNLLGRELLKKRRWKLVAHIRYGKHTV